MPLKKAVRGGVWHLCGTVAGQRIRESTGISAEHRDLAEAARIKREHQLLQRSIHGERGFVTFAEAAASYIETAPRRPATCAYVTRLLHHFGPLTQLKDINQVAVDKAYRAILTADATGATRLRAVLTPLRAIMEHAAIRGWCERPAFEAPRVAKPVTTFLLPAQATALVQAAAPHLRPLLVFLIGTGCRLSEALDLEWSRVDLRGSRAVVWQKQGNERQVDLPPVVLTALATISHRDGHVFRPAPRAGHPVPLRYADLGREAGGQIATGWAGACRRAGLPGRMVETAKRPYFQPDNSPHDCRHTFASWHYAIHKDPLRLMVCGGWSGLSQVQRYAHLMSPAYIEEARAWLAGGILEARRTA